jgi:hypothetical protein
MNKAALRILKAMICDKDVLGRTDCLISFDMA